MAYVGYILHVVPMKETCEPMEGWREQQTKYNVFESFEDYAE